MQNNNLLKQAVSLALAGDWHAAHHIVQDLSTHDACWIHAVLHKIEGDVSNSRYWYARTSKQYEAFDNAQEELAYILTHLNQTV